MKGDIAFQTFIQQVHSILCKDCVAKVGCFFVQLMNWKVIILKNFPSEDDYFVIQTCTSEINLLGVWIKLCSLKLHQRFHILTGKPVRTNRYSILFQTFSCNYGMISLHASVILCGRTFKEGGSV